jgi:hypothetical protein
MKLYYVDYPNSTLRLCQGRGLHDAYNIPHLVWAPSKAIAVRTVRDHIYNYRPQRDLPNKVRARSLDELTAELGEQPKVVDLEHLTDMIKS